MHKRGTCFSFPQGDFFGALSCHRNFLWHKNRGVSKNTVSVNDAFYLIYFFRTLWLIKLPSGSWSVFHSSSISHTVKYILCNNTIYKLRILVYLNLCIEKSSICILKQQIADSVCSIGIQDGNPLKRSDFCRTAFRPFRKAPAQNPVLTESAEDRIWENPVLTEALLLHLRDNPCIQNRCWVYSGGTTASYAPDL